MCLALRDFHDIEGDLHRSLGLISTHFCIWQFNPQLSPGNSDLCAVVFGASEETNLLDWTQRHGNAQIGTEGYHRPRPPALKQVTRNFQVRNYFVGLGRVIEHIAIGDVPRIAFQVIWGWFSS